MGTTLPAAAAPPVAFRPHRPSPVRPDPSLWARTDGSTPRLEPLRFRRAPMLWAALCFSAGAAATNPPWQPTWQPVPIWLAAFGFLAALTVLALGRHAPTGWVKLVPLAALWIVAGFASTELQPAPPPQTALLPFADGLSRAVAGRVIRVRALPSEPTQSTRESSDSEGYQEPEPPATLSVDLAVDAIEEVTPDVSRMVPVAGGIRATIAADPGTPLAEPGCGDTLTAPMRLRLPERYRDPGAWQYADYLLEQGIAAHATVRARRVSITRRPSASRSWSRTDLRCRLFAAQGWASARMLAFARSRASRTLPNRLSLSPDDAGMLNAMLFGDRAGLNHALRAGFERTGSFHLFVVSGMHVALIALGLFWLARRALMPLSAATLGTIALTTAYAALTGFGIPVQRALWMAVIFLLAQLFDRERNTLNALGLAILAVVVGCPSALFESSFQMTFLAVAGVAGIAIPLGERTFLPWARATRNLPDTWRDAHISPPHAQFRVLLRLSAEYTRRLLGPWAGLLPAATVRWSLYALELCLIGIVTELTMSLPMAVYFHRATLLALPANLASVPIVGLLVPAALATFSLALLSPWAALIPAAITSLLLHGITGAVGRIAHARLADQRVPEPAFWACAAAAACIAFCVWAVRRPGGRWGWATVAVLPCAAAFVLWPERPIAHPGKLEVSAIDVGQGDALLLVAPSGGAMLVDAGGPLGFSATGASGLGSEQRTTFDLGEEIVSPYLWSRRIRRLDVVVLTHEHNDHMGGMPAILQNFRPRELWVGVDVPSRAYAAMLRDAASLNIAVRHLHAGEVIPWSGTQVSVLGPEPGYQNDASPKNDDSLVLRLQFGASSVLLEGDAQHVEERAMLDHARIQPVTLLKAGHHGSITSSTEDFLAAAAPRVAVISSGRGNPFGHPRGEVVARFAQHGVKLYRTDMVGLTTFLLAPDGSIQAGSMQGGNIQGGSIRAGSWTSNGEFTTYRP